MIGVLLPGIIKRDFAGHAGTMTGVYTMALCLGAALAAGFVTQARAAGAGPDDIRSAVEAALSRT